MTYIRYNQGNGFINDIEDSAFDIIRQINEDDDFAQALEDGNLNQYYTLLAGYVGVPEVPAGETCPNFEERFSVYRKVLNYFILLDIDPLEYITEQVPACMFYGCEFITSVTIPNGIVKIGNYAFAFAQHLTQVNLSNSVGSLGVFPFLRTQVSNLTLSDAFLHTQDPFQASTFAGCRIGCRWINDHGMRKAIPSVNCSRQLEEFMCGL